MKRLALVAATVLCAATSLAQLQDLNGIKFCIDPGHGGHNAANDRHIVPDPGTDFWESESNFQKALLLKTLLERQGATVLLTRYTNDYPTDAEPSLSERVAFANANGVDWFHSIHSNAHNGVTNYTLMLVRQKIAEGGDSVWGPGVPGTPLWPQAWDISRLYMAPYIFQVLRTSSYSTRLDWEFYGGNNGGYTLGVLRGLYMPGELSEGSMHDVYPETRRLMNNDYRKMEAYALRNAWMRYFDVPADSLGIIAGLQTNLAGGAGVNYTQVRLLPVNRLYSGDQYNNGFYMFDSLPAGTYTVRFETPGYRQDSVTVSLARSQVRFADRQLESFAAPSVTSTDPVNNNPAVPANRSITLNFSRSMNTSSVEAAFSIAPSVTGTFTWAANNSSVTFDPSTILNQGILYTVRIETTATSSTGDRLDGNGDGVPGDPFILRFTTSYADVTPPEVATSNALADTTLPTPSDVINLTFNELLNPSTVSISNIALQEIGGLLQVRAVAYSQGGGRGGVTMWLPNRLKAGKTYMIRISRVADLLGNAISSSTPLLWQFYVGPDSYTYAGLDSLLGPLTEWTPPASNPVSEGVASALFQPSFLHRFPITATSGTTARLAYAWDTLASSWMLELRADSGASRSRLWRKENTVLQVYIHGDGSGDQVRFVVDDSVDAFPQGTPTNREVSRWHTVDWVGWKLLEWNLAGDTVGEFVGNGVLEGDLRFSGFQVRRGTALAAGGELFWAGLQLAEKVVVGVEAEAEAAVPSAFALRQNYPNPFNPSTTIVVDLPASSDVRLAVYDLLGREVAVLMEGEVEPGSHRVTFTANTLASGVYICRLTARDEYGAVRFTGVQKLLLAR